ncbi:TPA: hypothetical protein RVD89_002161 [Escherichia coli]|nr:hypothetical protein [Escherichia coli]HBM7810992.1 hypothetical protein [Escherichia coli]HCL5731318.1 hypothetical protein [Escherichia coli]HEA0156902.1 hypothetical protein [Escherichia coli]HEA1167154.1 hypothetical protein [Escherichia coli]
MNISTVNELIQSLESAGELSIREQKFLKLAKAFKKLAEENVGLRPLIAENWNMRDLLRQLMAGRPGGVYFNKWEKLIVRVLNETPATNRIVAGIKADAIDEAAVELDRVDTVASTRVIGFKLREFAKQLREGAK